VFLHTHTLCLSFQDLILVVLSLYVFFNLLVSNFFSRKAI
jgi:hypothetical protein